MKIVKQPTLIVTLQKLPNDRYTQGSVRTEWTPVVMLNLRSLKEVIVSYGMQSLFVKQMLNSWSICNRIIPKDWRDLAMTVLEPDPQLQWRTWLKEEAETTEHMSRARGMKIFQDQLLGGDYANIERVSLYHSNIWLYAIQQF